MDVGADNVVVAVSGVMVAVVVCVGEGGMVVGVVVGVGGDDSQ